MTASREAAQTARLSVLDELYLHLDRPEEPFSVHAEVRVEGRLDAARLAEAVRAAARRHPLARARLGDTRPTDVRYRWEVADELDDIDLTEVEGRDTTEALAALQSRQPALDTPGPFALLLARDPAGDVLALNLHHAAGDGLSAVRLLGSIARAYSGEADPVPDLDPLEARDLGALAGPSSLGERFTRGRAAMEYLERGARSPARIAPDGAQERPGYGFVRLALEPDAVAHIGARRSHGQTLNDLLLAGLAVTVDRWNGWHDAPTGTVYLTMPINLRPPQWRSEVLGNFASYVSVRVGRSDHRNFEAAARAVASGTRRIKDGGVAGLLVDLFSPSTLLPTAVKQRLQSLIRLTGDLAVDTAALSNLGRVEQVPGFGDAGAITELWFSPPGRMPLGASVGAATLGGRMFLTLRYRHALFGADAAADFLALYEQVLLGDAG